ncbi:MAG: aminopeptidase [Haloglomus sp.]
MDERIQRHAEIIVDHSTDVEAGDDVLLMLPEGTEDLGEAIASELGQRGATFFSGDSIRDVNRLQRAWLRSLDPDQVRLPEHILALVEASDVVVVVRGGATPSEAGDVNDATLQRFQQAVEPLMDEVMSETTWCGTQYPSPGFAQRAGMPLRGYEEFVWGAILRDWDAVREHQGQLADILEEGSQVRIRAGETTDVRASIDGMHAVNDYGEKNLPGGEVFTAPVVDSVEGEVLFDVPIHDKGQKFENVRLTFEDGSVVDYAADEGEELLSTLLDIDGADRVGELGFGMNRNIDRATRNILFDEKMGDTVHLALGRAYGESVGENREQNNSSLHLDFIVDMSEDSAIEVDGERIYEDGRYVFEEPLGGQ